MADDDSFKRHRSATSNTHGVGKPLSEAMPKREELSPDERRALFQQFLEWSAKQQSR
jgi:hypothetical protein